MQFRIGIDVGSTTVKVAVVDEKADVRFSAYRRHRAEPTTLFGNTSFKA